MKKMKLDFIGKDSVRYKNTIEVPDEVADLIKSLQKGKKPSDQIFSLANEKTVNEFLREFMPECTAKLFRTAYGTALLAEELQKAYKEGKLKKGMSSVQLKSIYNNAALTVSKKLNHQRNVAKGFSDQKEKMQNSFKEAKEKNKDLKEKSAKQLKALKNDILAAKSLYEGDKLKERLEKLKDKKEKIETRLHKSNERIEKLSMEKDFKIATANIALGTAKSNYSSPLIVASLCKALDADPLLMYNKSQLEGFSWAFEPNAVSDTYWLNYPTEEEN